MKILVIKILCFIVIAIICVGCSKSGNVTEQVKDVPTMLLEYTINGKTDEVKVASGSSKWRFDNGDGTFTEALADAPHPLDSPAHMPVIKKIDGLKELRINFSLSPNSYTVRRWIDDYIGNVQEHANDFEVVDVSDDSIVFTDDKQGYIYEVHAEWQQGNASYSFAVSDDEDFVYQGHTSSEATDMAANARLFSLDVEVTDISTDNIIITKALADYEAQIKIGNKIEVVSDVEHVLDVFQKLSIGDKICIYFPYITTDAETHKTSCFDIIQY